MVCIASIRDFIVRATTLRGFSRSKFGHFRVRVCGRDLDVGPAAYFSHSHRRFRTVPVIKMMVDSGTGTSNLPVSDVSEPVQDAILENEDASYGSGACKSGDGRLSYGYLSFRGRRPSMEDFYDIKTTKIEGQTVNLFGVFDGHGGSRAGKYLKEHLFENLLNHPKFITDTKLAIRETYRKTDSDFLDDEVNAFRDDGSTACIAIFVGCQLYVANVGDSRAVISKGGKAIPLSEDHKPDKSKERQRIEDAGGFVIWAGTWRVGGVLAMSRAFGNRMLKPYVVAEPDIKVEVIDDELELLVLATDGIWDVLPNEEAISLARTEEAPKVDAGRLAELAFMRGSADNITCVVVRFHHDGSDDAVVPSSSPSRTENDSL